MIQYIYLYLLTIPILIIGDILWVGFVASGLYDKYVGHLRGPIEWQGAILFYLVYTVGILAFVTYPNLNDLTKTVLFGALFGLVVYGVYNFTNHAVLKNWPMTIVAIDIVWGIVLTTTVSVSAYYIAQLIS